MLLVKQKYLYNEAKNSRNHANTKRLQGAHCAIFVLQAGTQQTPMNGARTTLGAPLWCAILKEEDIAEIRVVRCDYCALMLQ
jgi:hypothetical protein